MRKRQYSRVSLIMQGVRNVGCQNEEDGTISLKGIVQRKGPVALPSSGRKRTIWFSRVYASSEPAFTAGMFGVVVKARVKVLGFHLPGGFRSGIESGRF